MQRADRQARDKAAAQHLRARLDRVLERCVSAAIRLRPQIAIDIHGLPGKHNDTWDFAVTFHPIVDRAVSNSGDYGFCFDQEKRFNHLFNPANSGWADFYPSELGVCGLAFSDS